MQRSDETRMNSTNDSCHVTNIQDACIQVVPPRVPLCRRFRLAFHRLELMDKPRHEFFIKSHELIDRLNSATSKSVDGTVVSPYNPVVNVREDVLAICGFVLLLSLTRFFVERWLLFPLLTHLLKNKKDSRKIAWKASENTFYAVFYVISLATGWMVYQHESWKVNLFAPSCISAFWEHHPPVSSEFRFYYLFELSYYVSCVLFLLFHDTKRKDFAEFFTHHVATISLIVLSYILGWMRLGLIILLLHDVGDVFLYSAKVMHYLAIHPWDIAVFAIFSVVFYVSRLFLFPRVILAVTVEPWIEVTRTPSSKPEWVANWGLHIAQMIGFALFLNTLLYLHCFWFFLILKMIRREFLTPRSKDLGSGDIRSDDEDE